MQLLGHSAGHSVDTNSKLGSTADSEHDQAESRLDISSSQTTADTAATVELGSAAYQPIPRDRSLVPLHSAQAGRARLEPHHAARLRYHRLLRATSHLSLAALLKQADRNSAEAVIQDHEPSITMDHVHADRRQSAQSKSLTRSIPDKDSEEGVHFREADPVSIRIVRDFMAKHDIEILFGGTMRSTTAPVTSHCRDDLEQFLSEKKDVSASWLLDEIMMSLGKDVKKADIDRALRMIQRLDASERKNKITLNLIPESLPWTVLDDADRAWERLASGVFETSSTLTIACLKHFIWQVKQKLLGRPVIRHLMPIIYSPVQGGGKTTFLIKFLEPLQELRSGLTLISEFTDTRNVDLYRFPVIVIDDMEHVERSKISVLKKLMTASVGLQHRTLQTSKSEHVVQGSTLIGTANSTVGELVADRTGNRRFVGLLFRNGETDKGNREIWRIVNDTNYVDLWRSVNAYDPSPIEAFLEPLAELQEAERVLDELETWLCQLDMTSEEVDEIRNRHGMPADELRKLYQRQTGNEMSRNRFSTDMDRYILNPRVPFGPKSRIMEFRFYPIRPRK